MLTANYEYSRSNRENLLLPVQMHNFSSISEKPKISCCIFFFFSFIYFLESTLNFEHFRKNESPSLSISKVIDYERRAYLKAIDFFNSTKISILTYHEILDQRQILDQCQLTPKFGPMLKIYQPTPKFYKPT